MEAYVHGVSTRSVDDLVVALGGTGISKSEVGVLTDTAVGVDRGRPRLLGHESDRVPDGLGDREPHAVLH